jgi:hypothetical protein
MQKGSRATTKKLLHHETKKLGCQNSLGDKLFVGKFLKN